MSGLTGAYRQWYDDGLLNCDPWDLDVPNYDPETQRLIVVDICPVCKGAGFGCHDCGTQGWTLP